MTSVQNDDNFFLGINADKQIDLQPPCYLFGGFCTVDCLFGGVPCGGGYCPRGQTCCWYGILLLHLAAMKMSANHL